MAFVFDNPNPNGNIVGDCAVRAVSLACGMSWDAAYSGLCDMGFYMKDMPNADRVWGSFLKTMGFVRNTGCPECYTVREFAEDHPHGVYVLGTGAHVVAVVNGNYIDTYDSGDMTPIFYWRDSDSYSQINFL